MRDQGKKVTHVHLRWLSPLEPKLDALHTLIDTLLAEPA